jgi:hypothetical protein
VLLAVSLAINLCLAQQMRATERSLAVLAAGAYLHVGDQASSLDLLDGQQPIRIDYSEVSVPTLLYLMLPTCGYCKVNLPNMKALLAQAEGRYRMLIVSAVATGVEEYRVSNEISVPIPTVSPQTQRDLKLGGTPSTILISPDGKVLGVWHGAYTSNQEAEIENKLGVTLPGLDSAAMPRR